MDETYETYESMADMSRRELYSVVNALKRENNCLKTDLQTFAVISRKCRQYLRDLQNSGHIDSHVTQEILDLIDMNAQKTVVAVDALNVSLRMGLKKNIVWIDSQLIGVDRQPKSEVFTDREDTDSDGHQSDDFDVNYGSADECEDTAVRPRSVGTSGYGLRPKCPKKKLSFAITPEIKTTARDYRGVFSEQIMGVRLVGNCVCDHHNCGKSFSSYTNLRRHQSYTHPDKRFFCDHLNCCAHFGTIDRLTAHKRCGDHRPHDEPYECGLNGCKYWTESRDDLLEHIRGHPLVDQNSDKLLICDFIGCAKQFARSDHFKAHKRTHQRPDYCCDITDCFTSYAKRSELVHHLMSEHQKYLCDRKGCDYMTDDTADLLAHQLNHTNVNQGVDESVTVLDNNLIVNTVNKRKHDEDITDEHMPQSVAKKLKINERYVCDYKDCQKSYCDQKGLREHQMSHFGKRFYCDYKKCCKHFSHSSSLRLHKRNGDHEFGQTYSCGVGGCDFVTKTRSVLEKHIITHTPRKDRRSDRSTGATDPTIPVIDSERSTRSKARADESMGDNSDVGSDGKVVLIDGQYCCGYNGCDKTYNSITYLKRHQSSTHSYKRYFCVHKKCSKHFARIDGLNKHLKSGAHAFGQPFVCGYNGCAYDTKTQHNLIAHFKTSHSLDWEQTDTTTTATDTVDDHNPLMDAEMDDNSDDEYAERKSWPKKLLCDFAGCEKSYTDRRSLNEHKVTHSGRRFFCDFENCCKHFGHSSNLREHVRAGTHLLADEYRCSKNGCDYRSAVREEIEEHITGHSSDTCGGEFVCDWNGCAKRFRLQRTLAQHRQFHSTQPTRQCLIDGCLETFFTAKQLRRHISKKHIQNYRCDRCAYVGATKREVSKHQVCHAERLFACGLSGCEQQFKTDERMRQHQFRQHPDEFPELPWLECPHEGCPFETKSAKNMTHHSYSHQMKYGCDDCGKRFAHQSALTTHRRSHDDSLKIPCEWHACERLFTTDIEMRRHMNTHSAEITYRCHFVDCGKTYHNYSSFLWHKRRHQLMEKYRCHWPACDYQTTNQVMFDNHVAKHDSTGADYECDYEGCGKRYSRKDHLDEHKEKHMGLTYRCDVEGCVAVFPSRSYFLKHKTRTHGTKYRCERDGCEYATGDKNTLNLHLKTHNELQYKCPLDCGKEFKTSKQLSDHQLRLHPEAFPDRPWLECARPDCGYKTKMEGDFSRHVVKHTDKYACSECDKRYGRESELQHHMRSHDDTLKYRCQWPGCDRLFTSQTNYKYHMNGHTGETVYACEWEGCGKTSLSLKAIKNHMSKEHKG